MEFLAPTEQDLPAAVGQLLRFAGGRKKFALTGDLGAGKTALVQAFCRHLGVREHVTSPTFSLVNEYVWLDENGQEQLVHHLDLYRLRSEREALDIGVEDYLHDEHFCFVEWPEVIENLLPEDVVRIKISILPPTLRKILFL